MQDLSLSDMAAVFDKMPEIARRELQDAVGDMTVYLRREVQRRTPVGSGPRGLHSTIEASRPRTSGGGRRMVTTGYVGTPVQYAKWVEHGSDPHMPPVQPLIEWAAYKLGLSETEASRAGWGIAIRIRQRGTKAQRIFAKGLRASREYFRRRHERAMQRIIRRVPR